MKRIRSPHRRTFGNVILKSMVRFSVRPKDAARRMFCMTYNMCNTGCSRCEPLPKISLLNALFPSSISTRLFRKSPSFS